ncbi:MAG TPA: hypothetical protein VK063_04955 [Beutenbergiaceae bacterium]|nr:hypothetical protein [Beutenbergiaceae bacterium]
MAETWTPPWSGIGRWDSSGTFLPGGEPRSFNSQNWAYVWWDEAPVPDSGGLVSAVLRFTTDDRYTRWRLVDLDDAPVGDSGTPRPTATIDSGYTFNAGTHEADITDALAQVVSRPGWQPGNRLAVFFQANSTTYIWVSDVSLTVEYVPPVQYLEPVPFRGRGRTEPVESVEFSLAPAPVRGVGRWSPLDVLADRHITPAPFRAVGRIPVAGLSGTGHAPALTPAPFRSVGRWTVTLLSRTIAPAPPPIPWRRVITTPQYRAALASREPVTDARVEIINPDGAVIARLGGPDATHPGIDGGTVTCRGDAQIRWEHDLQLDSHDLVVRSSKDLLSPLSGNRMLVWHRRWMPAHDNSPAQWAEIPCGLTYPDWPVVADDGGAGLTLRVRGSDAIAELKKATFRDPIDVGGMYAHEAVEAILGARAPWATTALTPSDHRLAPEYEAGEPGGDPAEAIFEIADAAGMEFYADREGVLVLAPVGDQDTPVEELAEGPDSVLLEVSASMDMSSVANVVTYASTATRDEDGNDIAPVHGRAAVDDPTSPLHLENLGREFHHRETTNQVISQAEADREARRILLERQTPIQEVELTHLALPHLDPGDVVEVGAERAGAVGPRRVMAWNLALGPNSEQRTSVFGRKGLT